MKLSFSLLIIVLILQPAYGTWWGHKPKPECSSSNIGSWSSCHHRCGETAYRSVYAYCKEWADNTAKCRELCKVHNTQTSKNCYPSRCKHSDYCCPNECIQPVKNCASMTCDSSRPQCSVCQQYNKRGPEFSLFWPNGRRTCNPTCSWKGHSCWPGTCRKDHLAKSCQCNTGFVRVQNDKTTKCELIQGPELLNCDMGVQSTSREIANFTSTNGCHKEEDIFIRFIPIRISFKLESMLTLNITMQKMPHVENFTLGVVSGNIVVKKMSPKGNVAKYGFLDLPENDTCNKNFSEKFPSTSKVHCSKSLELLNLTMTHGDRLCVLFTASAGGYLTPKDLNSKIVSPDYYRKTDSTEIKCFQYDSEAPKHCSENGNCTMEPLHIMETITTSANVTITFDGWSDLHPNENKPQDGGGIESYEVIVHPMTLAGDKLMVDKTKKIYKYKSTNETTLEFSLPQGSGLYAVYLTVSDFAGNAQETRRFLLYDNSSQIETRNIPMPRVVATTSRSSAPWYSDQGKVCVTWYNLFRNAFLETHLKPIKEEQSIPGCKAANGEHFERGAKYDQRSGKLPVTGTQNSQGISKFYYSWQLNNGNISADSPVPYANNQSQCFQESFKDGDRLIVWLTAVDIFNRTLTKNLTVLIDRSVPTIEDIWLTKDGHREIYIHNSSDLSSMVLNIKAIDWHSGLKKVQWMLGTNDGSKDIGFGALPVLKLDDQDSCQPRTPCYCPTNGPCQMNNFTLTLNALVAKGTNKGQHNRFYFVVVRAENLAGLFNEEHLDIVLDESPPIAGIVQEGSSKIPDIDFTGNKDITVHWDGFIDHESGIYYYVVAITDRCLTQSELTGQCPHCNTTSNYIFNTTRNVADFSLPGPGKYFTTVIAYNNAMEPSVPVCSDGIVYDESPPQLKDVVLLGGRTRETVVCDNDQPWRINFDLTKKALTPAEACFMNCSSLPSDKLLVFLKEKKTDNIVKPSHCSSSSPKQPQSRIIGVPSDNIHLSWSYVEKESELLDFYVGIGSNPQMEQQPDILGYTSTEQKSKFRKHRLGMTPGVNFYIFIRSINRGMIAQTITLGPVIVDQTPPIYKGDLNVTVDNDTIYVLWHNDTLYDQEEGSDFVIRYQIKNNVTGKAVTPLQDYKGHTSCSGGFVCMKLPIEQLAIPDSQHSVLHFFELHVFNMAGLFTTVVSPKFQLPVRHPLNHGRVVNLDPNSLSTNDIRFHSKLHTACVGLIGFHPDVNLQVGIGTSPYNTNVVPYQRVTDRGRHCISSKAIKSFLQYYAVVRITLNAGSRVVASDGFIVVDKKVIKDKVRVFNGQGQCYANDSVSMTVQYNKTADSYTVTLLEDVITGHLYTINFGGIQEKANITGEDIKVMAHQSVLFNSSVYRSFIALSPRPTLHITFKPSINNRNIHFVPVLSRCSISVNFQTSRTQMSAHWEINGGYSRYVTHFQVGVVDKTCLYKGGHTCSVMDHHHLERVFHIDQRNLNFISGNKYSFSVQACMGEAGCTDQVLSAGTIVLDRPPVTGELQAQMKSLGNESQIDIHWQGFRCISGSHVTEPVAFQLKTLRQNGSIPYPVQSILNHKNENIFKHQSIFNTTLKNGATVTLITYCLSGLSTEVTVPIKIDHGSTTVGDHGMYVCEFDANTQNGNDLLGTTDQKTIIQHCNHNEADSIAHQIGQVGAILTIPTVEPTEWFLMSAAPQTPKEDCSSNINCVKSIKQSSKSVQFGTKSLSANETYYVCVRGNKALSSGLYQSFNACGDGFLIDSNPPLKGQVTVENALNGFISDRNLLVISWRGFSDHSTLATNNFYPRIASYAYFIGSYPETQNIVGSTNVGVSSYAVCENLTLVDGQQIFVTVKAYDMSGLSVNAVSKSVTVDTSAPFAGMLNTGSIIGHSYYVDVNELTIHWSGFTDKHSGIVSQQLGIGTSPMQDNVISFTEQFKEFAEIRDIGRLKDGHEYYATLKVTNGAGLVTTAVSEVFSVDGTPPAKGVVLEVSSSGKTDIDYQQEITMLEAMWFGFNDPHTGILFFRAGVGTAPLQDDVVGMANVGRKTGHKWYKDFFPGVKYFVTVEACNNAFVCFRTASNGIIMDNSAPLPGMVELGMDEQHHTYQAHRTTLNARWTGFHDPHSSMQGFEYCVGKQPLVCDVVPWRHALLTTSVVATNLHLPVNILLYVSVKGLNNVGLSTSVSSSGFLIDETPPVIVRPPSILHLKSGVKAATKVISTTDNSVLSLDWSFEDKESPIVNRYISLQPHDTGTMSLKDFQLPPLKNATIQLKGNERLQDGSIYNISMTVCNAAGLCTSVAGTHQIRVDSTGPVMGGFKPDRLSWDTSSFNGQPVTRLNLTWYGFEDIESGVDRYQLIIRDLHSQILSDPVTVPHQKRQKYQFGSALLKQRLASPKQLILEIMAENGVGLYSKIFKVTVQMMSGSKHGDYGMLDVQKHSCPIQYCNNECTCAAQGKKCQTTANTTMKCNPLKRERTPLTLNILGHNGLIASAKCLTAHWTVQNHTAIQRFEWSAGIKGSPVGDGIFDTLRENPWQDVGLQDHVTYCLPVGRELQSTEEYVFYIRAWYSSQEYYTFTSPDSVKVDQTPPSVRRGASVRDTTKGCAQPDMDYMTKVTSIGACWEKVFTESQSTITHYIVMAGTAPGYGDLIAPEALPTNITEKVSQVKLDKGSKYYFTVVAVNSIGLFASLSSDGFVFDDVPPVDGIVYNTAKYRSTRHQNLQKSLGISWHGFEDTHSAIREYQVAMGSAKSQTQTSPFTSVGIATNYEFEGLDLEHNECYVGYVQAIDAAGHRGTIVRSPEVCVDKTPPKSFKCGSTANILKEELKINHGHLSIGVDLLLDSFYLINLIIPSYTHRHNMVLYVGENAISIPLRIHKNSSQLEYHFTSAFNGRKNISLQFDTHKEFPKSVKIHMVKCNSVTSSATGGLKLRQISPTIISASLQVHDKESGIKRMYIGAGTTPGGFQINRLQQASSNDLQTIYSTSLTHGQHVYVTVQVENQAGLVADFTNSLVADHTPPKVNISHFGLYQDKSSKPVIEAKWQAEDKESGISDCFYGIGKEPETTNVLQWTLSPITNEISRTLQASFANNQSLFLSVVCSNEAGLSLTTVSGPISIQDAMPHDFKTQIHMVPVNEWSHTNSCCIQSDVSQLSILLDSPNPSISNYKSRVTENDHVYIDWTNIGNRRQFTFKQLALKDGSIYKVEVVGVDQQGQNKTLISNPIVVDSSIPKLTGSPVQIRRLTQSSFELSWPQVFAINPLQTSQYVVNIGSRDGMSDIVYRKMTDTTSLIFSSKIDKDSLYVSIMAIYETNLFNIYSTPLKI